MWTLFCCCSCSSHLKFLFLIGSLNKPSLQQCLYSLNLLLLFLKTVRKCEHPREGRETEEKASGARSGCFHCAIAHTLKRLVFPSARLKWRSSPAARRFLYRVTSHLPAASANIAELHRLLCATADVTTRSDFTDGFLPFTLHLDAPLRLITGFLLMTDECAVIIRRAVIMRDTWRFHPASSMTRLLLPHFSLALECIAMFHKLRAEEDSF